MSDIVERLRMLEKGRMWRDGYWVALQDDREVVDEAVTLTLDAADEIERLRAAPQAPSKPDDEGDPWRWQSEGNDLASMSDGMMVVISAGNLRTAIAAPQEPSQPVAWLLQLNEGGEWWTEDMTEHEADAARYMEEAPNAEGYRAVALIPLAAPKGKVDA